MNFPRLLLSSALWLPLTTSCVTVSAPVLIELVNGTSLDVTPNVYVSGSELDAGALFGDSANRQVGFTDREFPELRAGETRTLTFDCAEIRTIGVQSPVLFDATTLTVTTSTDQLVLTRGAEFDCGSTVRLVYYREGSAFHVRVE